MVLQTHFKNYAQEYDYDKRILNLPLLYKEFNNETKILSFHGKDDNLVDY